jgi:signal transduction histidine kinase
LFRIHPADLFEFVLKCRRAIDNFSALNHVVRFVGNNKEILWFQIESIPEFDTTGAYIGRLWVLTDITSHKKLDEEKLARLQDEEALQRRRADEAEQSRREQEKFIDMVSCLKRIGTSILSNVRPCQICHEVRNPLNAIQNNVEFLVEALESIREWSVSQNLADQSLEIILSTSKIMTDTISLCVQHQKVRPRIQ